MATITTNIRWADNTAALRANLLSGIDTIDAMKTAVDRTVRSLGGEGLLTAANKTAAAVLQLGGAAKLTATEQERVNTILEKAIDKYHAMGVAVPTAMQEIATATKKAEDSTVSFEQKLQSVATTARAVGAALSVAITAPLVGMAAAALKSSIDYESAFAGVRKTVSGTPAELQKLNDQFREMARTTPVAAVGLAKIGEMAGQLGVKKEKIAEFTKTIVDISVATNLTADEAGSAFARLANVTKMPQDQFSNLGSAVVALGNFGASTEKEMLDMGQRIAAAGSTAGMTTAQILGIANALSSVGIEAESGGTAISRTINKISMDVASGGGKLETFAKIAGLSAAEFSKAWRDDAGVAFSKFMQGLADARTRGGDELLNLMHELGFDANVRLVNAFMSAANAGDLMKDSIALSTKAFKENTEITRAAGERHKTTANQLKVLWNNLSDIAITLGDSLTPQVNNAVIALKLLVEGVAELAKEFKDAPDLLKLSVIGFGALAAAAGPLLLAVAGVAFTVAQVTTALATFPAVGIAAAGAAEALTTGMLGMVAVGAGVLALAGAVGVLAYGLTRLADIASGGKLSAWLTPFIAGAADIKLAEQEAGAGADAMALAFQRTGIHAKNAAEALALNTKWVNEHKVAMENATGTHGAFIGPVQQSAQALTTLAERVKALTEEQRQSIKTKVQEGDGIKTIAKETGIAIEVVSAYLKQQKLLTASQKDAVAAAKEYASAGEDLQATVDAMSGAVVEAIKWDLARDISQKTIQTTYGVTAQQIKAIISVEKEHATFIALVRSIEKTALAESLKEYDNWAKGVSKAADDVGKHIIEGAVQINHASGELADLIGQQTLSSTDYQIQKIEEWAASAKGAFKGTAEQAKAYYDLIDQLASRKTNAVFFDFDTIEKNSSVHLQAIADKAASTYDYMAAHSDQFSKATIAHFKKIAEEAQKPADGIVHTWASALDGLAASFTQLAQVSGGTFGGIVKDIAQIVTAMNVAEKSAKDFNKAREDEDSGGQVIAAVGMVSAMASATEGGGTKGVIGGMATGAEMGFAIAGPWGAAAGAAIGLIVGLLRTDHTLEDVARDAGAKFGTALSDATTKAIKADIDAGMSEVGAELNNFDKIIADAGGITDKNVTMMTARFHDLFSMMVTGQMTVKQVTDQLDKVFPALAKASTDAYGFISNDLKDLIHLNEVLGTHSKAIADFLHGQADAASTAFNDIIGLEPLAQWDALAKHVDEARAAVDKLVREGKEGSAEWKTAIEKLAEAQQKQTQGADDAKGHLADLGTIALATFNGGIKAGKNLIDVIRGMKPALDIIVKSYKDLGLAIDDPALKQILEISHIVNDNPALGTALSSLPQLLPALANLGQINQTTFDALLRTGHNVYDQALNATGGNQDAALRLIQPYLHSVQEYADKNGLKLDKNTQEMIDLSHADGIWQERALSAQELLDKHIQDQTEATKANTWALLHPGQQPPATPPQPGDPDYHPSNPNNPPPPPYTPPPYTPQPEPGPLPQFASEAYVRAPTLATIGDVLGGEFVLRPATLNSWLGHAAVMGSVAAATPTPIGGASPATTTQGAGAGASGDLYVSLVLDGQVVTKTVIKNVRLNRDGAYTQARGALGLTS